MINIPPSNSFLKTLIWYQILLYLSDHEYTLDLNGLSIGGVQMKPILHCAGQEPEVWVLMYCIPC